MPLRQFQTGDTRKGVSRASAYRYPAAAFGPPPSYFGTPVNEDGAERSTGSGSTSPRSTSARP